MSWQVVVLSSVSDVFNGKTPSKDEQRKSGHPVLKIKNVNEQGIFKGEFESFVDNELVKKFRNKTIVENDTLILNAAHNSDYVGSKQYRAEKSVVGALPTGEWLIIRANQEKIDPLFLNYWLRTSETRYKIKDFVKGIHLYPKDVARLQIPLPPLDEQKRIAAILDKADSLRRKRQQAIQLADEFLRAVFLDMFGDPMTNPKGWEEIRFGDVIDTLTDYHANGSYESLRDVVELKNSADYALMIRTTDLEKNNFNQDVKYISQEAYEFLSKSKVFGGEIIINKIGSAGAVYFMPNLNRPVSLAMNQFIIRCQDDCSNSFFFRLLKTKHGEHELLKRTQGAVTKTITKNAVRDIPLYKPPKEMQLRYEQLEKKYNSGTLELLNKSMEQANVLFNSLSQKAFAGEL